MHAHQFSKYFLVFILLVMLLNSSQTRADNIAQDSYDDASLEYAGSALWGNIKDATYDEPYLYCALPAGLEIYETDSLHNYF